MLDVLPAGAVSLDVCRRALREREHARGLEPGVDPLGTAGVERTWPDCSWLRHSLALLRASARLTAFSPPSPISRRRPASVKRKSQLLEPDEETCSTRPPFTFDAGNNRYVCPAGKYLKPAQRGHWKNPFRYRASLYDCQVCQLKPKCCPNMMIRKSTAARMSLHVTSLAQSARRRRIANHAESERR